MTRESSDDDLTGALVGLAHHVLHMFADAGRSRRLSQQQVELICAVVLRDSVGMTELGKLVHLEKTSLSNMVDRLEQRGVVVRFRDPADRRATRVALTAEGTTLAMETYTDVTGRLRELLDRIPAATQQHLATVVESLVAGKPCLVTIPEQAP